MHVLVTVDLDGDDLVVVKSATTPEAVHRLRGEAERLVRAAHPGVVALVAAGPPTSGDGDADRPGFELRLAHAGEPVTRWSPPLPDLAGVAAALATTLADLHDDGVVHGRVDASHVLVGDDGRPRLCGLSGVAGATPADDVAGWGCLVADLVARSRAPRRGVRVLARGRDRDRRAALLRVAAGAADPEPSRRPTARAVADAVMSAVPDAALPPRAAPGRPSPAAGPARGEVDTLDRIWSWAGEPTEDERWDAVFGARSRGDEHEPLCELPTSEHAALGWDRPVGQAGPSTAPDAPGWSAAPDVGSRGGDSWATRHDAGADVPGATTGADDDRLDVTEPGPPAVLPGFDADTDPYEDDRRVGARTDDTWQEQADPDDPWAGARTDGATPDDHGGPDDPWADALADDEPPDDPGDPSRLWATGQADQPTRDHQPVDRGRRRAAADPAPEPARRGGRLAVAAVGTAAVLVAGAWATAAARDRGPGGGADASRPPPPRADCPPVVAPAADVDGDGCREALVVQGATVDAGVAAWTIGEPGDVVALGDWDCDGEASPAVLRPDSGDVFVFSTWAALDEPVTVPPVDRVPGGRTVRAEPAPDGACDRLVVDRADGAATGIEVPPGG